MNDNRTFKLFVIVLIITVICVFAFTGLGPENARIIKGVNEIRTGIDIRGGISAILEPVYPNGSEGRDIKQDLESSQSIIEDRLDAQGIYDKSINIDSTNNRLIIDIPWAANETEFDPRKALDDLGSTGALTFQEVNDEDFYTEAEDLVPSGRIVLSGEDIQTASSFQDQNGQYMVLLKLKTSGVEAFSKATGENIGKRIAIFIDDMCISAPRVDSQITSTEATITGNFTFESAKALADKIRFGALPTKLEPVKVDAISAQLGKGALEVAINAGVIAFILVCIFMILSYRLPGVVSVVALSGLLTLQILTLANFDISVTLPGIGGIILSIGMSIDGNVVIFERIKEELREGKTLRAAIDLGFKRAFVAILDSNVTTIITAVVLYILGSGPVRGFGVTLFFGTLFSFFSAITASKMMLQGLSAFKFAQNKWLFGLSGMKGGKKIEEV
ncbi:MAG: protein translocase subunit SecD [Acetivibrionales bacterium]|jgi:preprotein translocase subunit SecD|nr:protein translocase subunit SecD [Clostridiaceae bacterium]